MNSVQLPESLHWDPESSGQLSRALVQGHDFAYWLSLLSTQLTDRTRILSEPSDPQATETDTENYYRNAPMEGRTADLSMLRKNAEFTALQQETSLRLWQSMHPDPLALDNDPTRIEDEVIENCELTVRQRFKQTLQTAIPQTPTDLIDTVAESQHLLV